LLVILLGMIVLAIVFGIVGFDDLVGLDVLTGFVAILGTTLGFVVICAYLADAIVVLLSLLPVIGPWIKFVVIVLGLGAVLLALYGGRRSAPPPVPQQVLMNQ
jgi:hypothetical protein